MRAALAPGCMLRREGRFARPLLLSRAPRRSLPTPRRTPAAYSYLHDTLREPLDLFAGNTQPPGALSDVLHLEARVARELELSELAVEEEWKALRRMWALQECGSGGVGLGGYGSVGLNSRAGQASQLGRSEGYQSNALGAVGTGGLCIDRSALLRDDVAIAEHAAARDFLRRRSRLAG